MVYTWTGEGDNKNWHDPLNWNPNGIPVPNEDQLILGNGWFIMPPANQKTLRRYLRFLHNTLVILGADIRIAVLLNNPEIITETDVAELCQYNLNLIDATKDRLSNLNSKRVEIVDQDD